jgi:hypothetical protein
MPNEIISYLEMCRREGSSLQRGMNFGLGGTHSVILMSVAQMLQNRASLRRDWQIVYYAFDLLELEGEDWKARLLTERKQR